MCKACGMKARAHAERQLQEYHLSDGRFFDNVGKDVSLYDTEINLDEMTDETNEPSLEAQVEPSAASCADSSFLLLEEHNGTDEPPVVDWSSYIDIDGKSYRKEWYVAERVRDLFVLENAIRANSPRPPTEAVSLCGERTICSRHHLQRPCSIRSVAVNRLCLLRRGATR